MEGMDNGSPSAEYGRLGPSQGSMTRITEGKELNCMNLENMNNAQLFTYTLYTETTCDISAS